MSACDCQLGPRLPRPGLRVSAWPAPAHEFLAARRLGGRARLHLVAKGEPRIGEEESIVTVEKVSHRFRDNSERTHVRATDVKGPVAYPRRSSDCILPQ